MSSRGSKNRESSFPKGLKREARNCQQAGVKRAQHPRGTVWIKKGQKYKVAYCSDRYTENRDKQFCIES